ncbi:Protein of unknown function [Anaplasma phagocytophilum]|uniref:Uncharacterized protein n=1 Tax=Anaplasma phagocytophilum TaxID=948 RepID=A0A098EGW6_ANAPH|nr:Protein of unknown function [Anaplasma phagocytophilum]
MVNAMHDGLGCS